MKKMGADINVKNSSGRTPLHYAADNGHTTIVEYLLTKGAEINVKNNNDNTPLQLAAAANGRKDMVALLQRKGGTM